MMSPDDSIGKRYSRDPERSWRLFSHARRKVNSRPAARSRGDHGGDFAPRATFIADAPPSGFGFNQYLIAADQPLLFHCGGRGLFPLVSAAAAAPRGMHGAVFEGDFASELARLADYYDGALKAAVD